MRFLAAVDAFMRVQRARSRETLVTDHADMRFLPFKLITILDYWVDPTCYMNFDSVRRRMHREKKKKKVKEREAERER